MSSHAYGGSPPGMVSQHHWGVGSIGIPGSVLATGGFIYPSVSLPADANKEYYALLTPAAGLTLLTGEPGDYDGAANDGTYVSPFDLYEWGVKIGSSTLTLKFAVVDLTGANVTGTATSGTGSISVTPAGTPINLTGATTTGGAVSGTGAITVTPAAAGTVNLSGATTTGSAISGTGAISITATTSGGVGNSQVTVPAIRTARFVAHSRVAVFNTTSPILLTKGALDELYFVGDFTKDLNDGATTAVSVAPVSAGVTVLESPTLQGALGVVKLGALDTSGGPNYFTWRVTCANGEQFDRTITLIVVDDRTWMFGKDPDDLRFWTFDISADLALSGNTTITSVQTPIVVGVRALSTPAIQGNLTIVKIGGLDATVTNSCQMTFLFATGEKITRAIYFKEEDH